ncbi:MAG: AMP-binding protein [Terriglobia bacterium]
MLTRLAAELPDHPALVAAPAGVRWGFCELETQARRLARGLLALGIGQGDRVAVWANNIPAWVVLQFAAAKVGAILVTVNTALRRDELAYLLRQSEAKALFLVPAFKDVDYRHELVGLLPELQSARPGSLASVHFPELRHVVLMGGELTGAWRWEQVEESAARVPEAELERRERAFNLDDVINMQYTSGTTGFPKGVMLTHRNIVNNGYWVAEKQRLTTADRLCTVVPLFHCFGCVIAVLGAYTHGATLVLVPHFDPQLVLETLSRERCTALYGVPTMFLAEREHPDFARFDLSCLRTGVMAGSVCPEGLVQRVMREMHLPELTIAYGLTEASPAVTQTSMDDPRELRCRTVGKALPEVEVKIADPKTGSELPRGQEGELWTRGYLVMKGYYNNAEATRQAITPEGWLRTGDLASMDAGGYVVITGRLKEMIIRAGENIYPKEIEEFLRKHPAISDVAVYGIPSRFYGEEVAAAVRLKSGASLTLGEIEAFCHDQIARYKIPRYIKFVDAFPQTASGKIQKFKLRETAAQDFPLETPTRAAR